MFQIYHLETHENSEGEDFIEVNSFLEKEEESKFAKTKDVWSLLETRHLFDRYETYLPQIGPEKKFHTKKEMWKAISEDINTTFSLNKTGTQCENRYKTIWKRKLKVDENTHRLNCSRLNNSYEVEFKKLIAIGDSLEAEQCSGESGDEQSHQRTDANENSEGENEVTFFLKNEESSNSDVKTIKDTWTQPETKFMLDKYETYLPQVGPQKKFTTKKRMWKAISQDIHSIFSINKTEAQCENRYKTLLKRKKQVEENNPASSSSTLNESYEVEFKNVNAFYDSIEPEQPSGDSEDAQTHRKRIGKRKLNAERISEKVTLAKLLLELKRQKEENKERRHREKMQMMEKLMCLIKKK